MKKIISAVIGAFLVGFLVYGVTYRKKEIPVEKPGKVTATQAYREYFGPAPGVPKGDAFAFALYFPLAEPRGKVLPLPFFTFDRQTMRKVALERLISGNSVGPYKGKFELPVPGLRLLSLVENGDTVTATFSKELPALGEKTLGGGFAVAAAMSLYQFDGVRKVVIKSEDGRTYTPGNDIHSVSKLPPPQLLNVVAMKEKGEKDVHEVDVFFDRPVDFQNINIGDTGGRLFRGEVYASAFDMAAVLKPKDPSIFQPGKQVRVTWKVTDKNGRVSEGTQQFEIEMKEH
jgi:germination protein M